MDLTEILPKKVGIETESYVSGLIVNALDRRQGEADLTTLLRSVKTQALGKIRLNHGQIAYCMIKMIKQGEIVKTDGRYSLDPAARDNYFKIGGSCSED